MKKRFDRLPTNLEIKFFYDNEKIFRTVVRNGKFPTRNLAVISQLGALRDLRDTPEAIPQQVLFKLQRMVFFNKAKVLEKLDQRAAKKSNIKPEPTAKAKRHHQHKTLRA